jgi:hypothetical protein
VWSILAISSHVPTTALPHRKVFGDGADESTGTTKKLVLTNQTTYKLMRKQIQQAASGTPELQQQVCIWKYSQPF